MEGHVEVVEFCIRVMTEDTLIPFVAVDLLLKVNCLYQILFFPDGLTVSPFVMYCSLFPSVLGGNLYVLVDGPQVTVPATAHFHLRCLSISHFSHIYTASGIICQPSRALQVSHSTRIFAYHHFNIIILAINRCTSVVWMYLLWEVNHTVYRSDCLSNIFPWDCPTGGKIWLFAVFSLFLKRGSQPLEFGE